MPSLLCSVFLFLLLDSRRRWLSSLFLLPDFTLHLGHVALLSGEVRHPRLLHVPDETRPLPPSPSLLLLPFLFLSMVSSLVHRRDLLRRCHWRHLSRRRPPLHRRLQQPPNHRCLPSLLPSPSPSISIGSHLHGPSFLTAADVMRFPSASSLSISPISIPCLISFLRLSSSFFTRPPSSLLPYLPQSPPDHRHGRCDAGDGVGWEEEDGS